MKSSSMSGDHVSSKANPRSEGIGVEANQQCVMHLFMSELISVGISNILHHINPWKIRGGMKHSHISPGNPAARMKQ